jgi:hypothetical protein
MKSGGPVHKERAKSTDLNVCGNTTAFFAGHPDEEGWEYAGEEYGGEPARQCPALHSGKKVCNDCETSYNNREMECPECGSIEFHFIRCQNRCEPGKATCKTHGGAIVRSKEHADLAKRGSLKGGLNLVEIMLCPCIHEQDCQFANQLVDPERYGSNVPRCLPEQEFYDSLVEHFQETYTLDPAADQIMLSRLAMSYLRIMRGEKIIAKYGEIVERTRTSPDGSYESWYEQSSAAKTVESLDRRLQAWLKELAISKAAREGKKLTVNGNIDITSVLSVPAPEDQIIDIEVEDVDD